MNIIKNTNKTESIKKNLIPKFLDSTNVIIITGFSSLDFFADFIKQTKKRNLNHVRLLLGSEFNDLEIKDNKDIKKIVQQYWQKRGFSLSSIKNIKILRDIVAGDLKDPFLNHLEIKIDATNKAQHSKIYGCNEFFSIGSSNFTKNGFQNQKETNYIIEKDNPDFNDIENLCEEYWNAAECYKDDLLRLLDNLLSVVNYKEVLKLIHDDFINNEWFENKNRNKDLEPLWKHQEITVAETLISLNRTGAAIIAEPTGSGKTKASVEAVRVLYEKYFSNGRNYMSPPIVTVIAPPRVEEEWMYELESYGIDRPQFISSGILSQGENKTKQSKDSNFEKSKKMLKNTDILIIDEAHEYKELENNKSLALLQNNNADYTLFLTATPMNKGLRDYFGFLVLIGANSLDDSHRESINELFIRKIQNVNHLNNYNDKKILEDYVKAIKSVTIRKTKTEINSISKKNGVKTYPEEITEAYSVNLSNNDISIINEIKRLSENLNGLAFFSNKDRLSCQDAISEKDKAKGIAKWKVLCYLRSSPAALINHIKGSEKTIEMFDIEPKLIDSKDSLEQKINNKTCKELIRNVSSRFKEENERYLENISDPELFDILKMEEILTYERIYQEVCKLSSNLVESKVNEILKKADNHKKVIVFDQSPVSVIYYYNVLRHKLNNTDVRVLYATGKNGEVGRNEIKSHFSKHNKETLDKRCIAICSNVLSESVNLEVADVELFLDIPTTPIIAEQRIGRVSRMSSSFNRVYICWPEFPQELMVNTDKFLCERLMNINSTIEGNIHIPQFLINYADKNDSYVDIGLNDYGIQDDEDDINNFEKEVSDIYNTKSVFDLFYDSKNKPFFDLENINKKNNSESIYSFVEDSESWGLFYIQDPVQNIPTLCFVSKNKDDEYDVFYDYEKIIEKFLSKKSVLNDLNLISVDDHKLNNTLITYEKIINNKLKIQSLTHKEKSLLELLEEMSDVLPSDYSYIKDMLNNNFKNKKMIANNWLQFIKPHWIEYISKESEVKESLPLFIDLKYFKPLQESLLNKDRLKGFLENGINNQMKPLKIKAAIISL